MKKYLSLMKCGILEAITYRNNFIISMLANFLQVVVLYYVWKSVFQYRDVVNGYTWDVMKRYVFVAFLCNSTFSFGFEMQTAGRIIKGDIILDLLKPMSYRSMIFYKMVGMAGMEFLITLLIISTVYVCVNGISGISLWRIIISIVSMLLGQGNKFQIQYLFSMLCFYTDNAYGVLKGREVLTNFFSGALVPLAMFPILVKEIVQALPFSGIVFIPCSIFIGTYSKEETLVAIVFQIIWCILLFGAGSIFWKKASSVVVIYGG